MLLNDLLLAKSGPLAKIWLSATQEKKLTKSHVTSIDLSRSVEAILARGGGAAEAHQNGNGNEDVNMDAREGEEDQVHVDVPVYAQQGGEVGEGEGMVLRMSGQLMLGVVRIYGRKAQYLMDDAKDVRDRITMAFRPGAVDLPADQLIAPRTAITLPSSDLVTGGLTSNSNGFDALLGSFENWNWDFAKGFEKDIGFDLAAATGNARYGNGYSESVRSASVARESESGIDSNSVSGRAHDLHHRNREEGLDLGINLGDDDETLSSIEFGRDAQREREGSILSPGMKLARAGRHGSVMSDAGVGGRAMSVLGGLDEFSFGDDGGVAPMDLDFEGGLDLGLDMGDPIPGLDLGRNAGKDQQDRSRRETSRLTTPPPLEDESDRMTAMNDMTPRTAARIAKLAEIKAKAAERAAGTQRHPKRVRLMAVDDEIELEEERGIGRRDVSHLLTEERFVPSDKAMIAFEKIQQDPAAFYCPTIKQGNQMFFMTTFEQMAPELASLFMVPTGPGRRDRPVDLLLEGSSPAKRPRLDVNGEEEDEDEIEFGRRQSRALSQRLGERDDPIGGKEGGVDFGYDDLGGMGDDTGFDELGDIYADPVDQHLKLNNSRAPGAAGSRAGSVVAASTVADVGVSGADCLIAAFDTRPKTGSSQAELTESMNASQFAAALEQEAGADVNDVEPALRKKLGFSQNTITAINILRTQLSPPAEVEATAAAGEATPTTAKKTAHFAQVSKNASRRAAASFFFELLVLGTKDQVKVKQDQAFGDIDIEGKSKLWEGVAA